MRSHKQTSQHAFSVRILRLLLPSFQLQLSVSLSRRCSRDRALFLGVAICLRLHRALALLRLAHTTTRTLHGTSALISAACHPSSPCRDTFRAVPSFSQRRKLRNGLLRSKCARGLRKAGLWCTALTRLKQIEKGRPLVYCAKVHAE